MKILLSTLMILVATVATSKAQANDLPFPSCEGRNCNVEIQDGRPWPWGSEIRFPWTLIEGVWSPVERELGNYFVFKVSKENASGDRVIQITQYDPYGCQKVAVGAGYENNRVIYAAMTTGSGSYDLTVRAFDNSVLKKADVTPSSVTVGPKSTVVVTMYPRSNWNQRVSYQLDKLQSTPALICGGK